MTIKNFPSSFPLGVGLDSVAIWKKGEQFVVVMSPPKGKRSKKQTTPWVAFALETRVYEDDGDILGECPALDVVSCGKNEQNARKNIQEAVTLFLESCAERETLGTVLRECGFRKMHKSQKPLSEKHERMQGITIPDLHAIVA